MTWYEELIDFFLVDLIDVFTQFGVLLFTKPKDIIPGLSAFDLTIFGFNFANTPLIGYFTAYVIYLFIGIRLVRLVIGG